jgi:hypothetical protein
MGNQNSTGSNGGRYPPFSTRRQRDHASGLSPRDAIGGRSFNEAATAMSTSSKNNPKNHSPYGEAVGLNGSKTAPVLEMSEHSLVPGMSSQNLSTSPRRDTIQHISAPHSVARGVHVEYDRATGRYIGLPDGWEHALRTADSTDRGRTATSSSRSMKAPMQPMHQQPSPLRKSSMAASQTLLHAPAPPQVPLSKPRNIANSTLSITSSSRNGENHANGKTLNSTPGITGTGKSPLESLASWISF